MVYIAVLPPAGRRTTWASIDQPLGVQAPAREIGGAADRYPRRLEPVLGERPLQLLDHGPFQRNVGVAPMSFLAPVAAPPPLIPEPPVTPVMPSTTRIRRWLR